MIFSKLILYQHFVNLVQQPSNQNGRNAKQFYGHDPLYSPHAPHVYDLTGVIHSIRTYTVKSILIEISSKRIIYTLYTIYSKCG